VIATATVSAELLRRIEHQRPLAPLTTFKIGGPAEHYLRARTRDEAIEAATLAACEGWELRTIGGGSNLLIPDQGVRGLVLDLGLLKTIQIDGTTMHADAGANLAAAINTAAKAGLAGIEGLSGIPGTLGGALVMNAGGRFGEIGDSVASATLLSSDGTLREVDKPELGFGYRTSQTRGYVVLSITLSLTPGDPKELLARSAKINREKVAAQPYDLPSAGCIFRNPKGACHGAGKLIELAGLKGERAGDAEISGKHGNFIVNRGAARCSDVEELVERAKARVLNAFGVELETEVRRWAA
jgi:UDP-N-acetylmuramate dehydrogenase